MTNSTTITIIETIENEFETIIIQKIVISRKQEDNHPEDDVPLGERLNKKRKTTETIREFVKCSYCYCNISEEFLNTHIEIAHHLKTKPIIEEPVDDICEFTGNPLKVYEDALKMSNQALNEDAQQKKQKTGRKNNLDYTKIECPFCPIKKSGKNKGTRRMISKNQMASHMRGKHKDQSKHEEYMKYVRTSQCGECPLVFKHDSAHGWNKMEQHYKENHPDKCPFCLGNDEFVCGIEEICPFTRKYYRENNI